MRDMECRNLVVIDGDAQRRAAFVRQLDGMGCTVAEAGDGQQALDLIQQQAVDLALLHIHTPGMDACELLTRIKSIPGLSNVPVVMLCAGGDDDMAYVAGCIEAGAEDYMLENPLPALLRARVNAFLEKKHLRDVEQKHVRHVEQLANDLKNCILPIGISLSAEDNYDPVFERTLLEAIAITGADAGGLYLVSEDKKWLHFAFLVSDSGKDIRRARDDESGMYNPLPLYDEAGAPNHRNLATYVALTGETVNIPDLYDTGDQFDFSGAKKFDKEKNYRTVSALNMPLKSSVDEVVGVLQLLNARDAETGEIVPFDSYHQLTVEMLASLAAIALNNQLLMRHQIGLTKFEHDMQVGHRIQSDFLLDAQKLPQPEGWELAARLYPARQVAGDFYDSFLMTTQKRLGFLVADVCDKGVGAALFMALMRSLLRAFALQHHSVNWSDVLAGGDAPMGGRRSGQGRGIRLSIGALALEQAVMLTNDYVATNHADLYMFATVFFGLLDPATGSLLYINGGHNPPIVLNAKGELKARLDPSGPAVGMMPNATFKIQQINLDPGDILFAFSDGVVDARDPQNNSFTDAHLLEFLQQEAPSADEALSLMTRLDAALHAHIAGNDQFDDITMMILRRAAGD